METTRESKEEQRNLRSTDPQAPSPLWNQTLRSHQPRSTATVSNELIARLTRHQLEEIWSEKGKTSPSRDPFADRRHHNRREDRPQAPPQTTMDHQIWARNRRIWTGDNSTKPNPSRNRDRPRRWTDKRNRNTERSYRRPPLGDAGRRENTTKLGFFFFLS